MFLRSLLEIMEIVFRVWLLQVVSELKIKNNLLLELQQLVKCVQLCMNYLVNPELSIIWLND